MTSGVTKDLLSTIISLREKLYNAAEPSGGEKITAQIIKDFLILNGPPDEILSKMGGNGLAAIFRGSESGPRIIFRADMDAIAIPEKGRPFSHKCGHDGHMAIVAGLALLLKRKFKRGEVVLLFQPAEETGQGASNIISDQAFQMVRPDFVFAFHNLPGHPLNSVILREGSFACASVGLKIRLEGVTSHASEPEKAISPTKAVEHLISSFQKYADFNASKHFQLLTITHIQLGEPSFGITPGYADFFVTLRSDDIKNLDLLKNNTSSIVKQVAMEQGLDVQLEWKDEFPLTVNHPRNVQIIMKVIEELKLDKVIINHPFRWSEDFGHFSNHFKSALMGLGMGENHLPLHHHSYTFDDRIIPSGLDVLWGITCSILND